MAFWLIAAAMLIAAVAVILPPLLHRAGSETDAPERHDLTEEQKATIRVYRERLAELRREHELGHLSAADLEAAETEAKRELLAYVPDAQDAQTPSASHRLALIVAALIVPAVALALYSATGRPELLDSDGSGRLTDRQVSQFAAMAPQQRIPALEDYVAQHPGAPRAWTQLAAAYRSEERYEAAAEAFGRARAAGRTPDARLTARQAESLLLANDRQFTDEVQRLIDAALRIDPRSPLGLMLAGHAALTRGDNETAVERWQRLAEQIPEGDQRRRVIEGLIARAGGDASAQGSAGAAPTDGSGATASEGGDAAITVRLHLSDDLRDQVAGGDTVFVFARRADAADGPPLAVQRTTVDALPAAIELTDAQAMVPGRTLSSVERVVVTARVSRSGDVSASPGDLEGRTDAIPTDRSEPVELTIDRTIQ
jgi:cytochrome c-type biogenesis protein CcmH